MMTAQQIIDDIQGFIRKYSGVYPVWYIGIAADPQDRLVNGHNVNENSPSYIIRGAATADDARSVERHFVELGCQGGPGGGDSKTRSVYAYKITSTTRQ